MCVGRGGAKSTTLYKIALYITLFGRFTIPSSQIHYALVLSRMKAEAEKGLRIVAHWLGCLGVEYRTATDVVELKSMNRGLRIVSASVFAASGWRAFFIGADEFAKWASDGVALLDADETLSSAKAMTATHPHAPCMVASTPWVDAGTFYETITRPPESFIVSGPAPSWMANPDAITEAGTRRKEPDPRRWKREYACVFSSEFTGGFFPPDAVDAATDRERGPRPDGPRDSNAPLRYLLCIDPAFAFDRFGIAICHGELQGDGSARVWLDYLDAIEPPRGGTLSADRCVDRVCELRRVWQGDRVVFSDQHSQETLSEAFARRGVGLKIEAWSMQSKLERFSFVRELLCDGRLRLPDDPELRREMSGIGVALTRAGNEVVETRGGSDDRVSAMVHAAFLAAKWPTGALVRSVGGQTVDVLGPVIVFRDGTIHQ